jgi:hypothetical protein
VDEESTKALRGLTVEQLRDSYKAGKITSGRYEYLLHQKAHISIEDANLDSPSDYAKKMWEQSVKHFQEGWDSVVEAATRDTAKDTPVLSDIYYSGAAAWGMFGMLMAPLTAFGEINGELARRLAVGAGASPGAARYIGLGVDLASGLVPAGKIAQSAAKGIQGAAKAGTLGASMQKISKLTQELKQLELTMAQGAGTGVKAASGVAPQAKLNLNATEVTQAITDVIKPGLSKEATLEAALVKLQGDAPSIDAAAKKFVEKNVEGWFDLVPSQAEMPFRVMGEALAEEGVKLNKILESVIAKEVPVAKIATPVTSFGEEVAKHTKDTTIEAAKAGLPALASKLGIDLEALKNVTPGGRFDPKNAWYANPKKMYGYLKALESRSSEIGPLAKAALEGGDAEKLAFAKYMAGLFTESPDGKMRIGKEFTDMMMHWDPENMAAGKIGEAVTTFAKDMAHMADKGGDFGKMIFDNQAGAMSLGVVPELWAKARNIYLNSLLPFSWKAAFLGNVYATGNAVMERAIGAAFSANKGQGYNNKEALYLAKGLMLGVGDGIKAFGDAYRFAAPGVGRFSHSNPFDSWVGQIINIPMNTVKGMDNIFSTIITRASHYATAAREGEQLGFKGAALGSHINQRVATPTADMLNEAKQLAEVSTFQNQLGGFMGKLQGALQYGPLVYYFPFVKSGVNLAKYVWDRTPGLQLLSGQLYKDIASGGAKSDAAIARLVMGQLMGHYYMELAKDGFITGGGPVDPQVKRSWDFTHQRYSVATATGWVPISNMEPMNTLPGMMADIVEIIDELDPLTAEQAAMAVGFAAMRNFTNNTWWQSNASLQDAIQTLGGGTDFTNPSYRFLRSPISAPFQPLAQFARANDPIQRQTRSYLDDIASKVPWKTKTLPPVRDGVADPVVPPIAFGGSWLGLMRPIVPAFRPYETDPLKVELARLGVKIPLMNDHLGGKLHEGFDIKAPRPEDKFGIRLSNEELDERMQIYRNIIRHPEYGIEAFMKDPDAGYAGMTEPAKRSELERLLTQAWNQSGQALMVKRPELGQKILESDAKSIMAKTPPEEKAETVQTLATGIQDFMDQSPEEQDNLMKFGIIGPKQPDNATYSTPYGPLVNIRQVPPGTPGAERTP